MEKFNELLVKLKGLNITQESMDWEECLPEEIWKEHFKDNHKVLKTGLNPDKHRWYETTISVISIYDRLLGIRHISKIYSESSSCEDCAETLGFDEMKEITVISYEAV